jgi:hypothetical protein
VQALGGSTGAKLVADGAGNRFVLKRGNSEGHLREEVATDAFYRAVGVPVPEFKLYETPSGPVKLAKFVKGVQMSELSGPARSAMEDQVRRHFASDALIGNWDVVGLHHDNTMLVGDKAMRIDNGGAMRYRAQGSLKTSLPKSAHFDGVPNEIFTLRSSAINPQAASVFSKLPYGVIVRQMTGVLGKRKAIEAVAPAALRSVISARLDSFERLVKMYRNMKRAGASDSAIEAASKAATEKAKAAGKWD